MANTSKGTSRSKASSSEKTPKAIVTARKPRTSPNKSTISPQQRLEMIAESAYLRAARRGFGPGNELEDWLTAEREVDLLLTENATTITQ